MKRKILSILLIGTMVIGLTGCGSNNAKNDSKESNNNSKENAQVEAKNIENIKEFLGAVNSKDYDKASSLLAKEKINELLKINLPIEDYSKSLNYAFSDESNTIIYDVNSIKKITKDELLNEIYKMNENEIIKNRKYIIDLFDGFDLYIIDCSSLYKEGKMSLHDVVFVNPNNSKLTGTVIINGLIGYYYNAIYNKPSK